MSVSCEKLDAGFRGDRKARRHGNGQTGHLRQAGAFAAQERFHLAPAFRLAAAEIIDKFAPRPLACATHYETSLAPAAGAVEIFEKSAI